MRQQTYSKWRKTNRFRGLNAWLSRAFSPLKKTGFLAAFSIAIGQRFTILFLLSWGAVSLSFSAAGVAQVASDLPQNQLTGAGNVVTELSLPGRSPLPIDLLQPQQDLDSSDPLAEVAPGQQSLQPFSAPTDGLNPAQTWRQLALMYHDLRQWGQARMAIDRAIADSQPLAASGRQLAQLFTLKGEIELSAGQAEAALTTWQQAEVVYRAVGDDLGILGSQVNQAQALQTLGFYRRARMLLEAANDRLQAFPDSSLKASGLHSLGIALLRVGDPDAARTVLQSALAISERSHTDGSSTLLALGNVARATDDTGGAIAFYQQAAAGASEPLVRLQAMVNQFSLLVEMHQSADAEALLANIQPLLRALLPSRAGIYVQVNLAEGLMRWSAQAGERSGGGSAADIAQLLTTAVRQARALQDERAETYALGQLGHLYETVEQWADAKTVTEQAIRLAQRLQADDITVSWQWQLGRIFKQQNQVVEAIAAYDQAVSLLSELRGDLVAMNPEVQVSFRRDVEPIYRQFAQLLLLDEPTQANLKRARAVIEGLQLAELNNFFREACLDAVPQQIDQIDPQAAVLYSIILPDRLAVILSRPGQLLRYYATPLATHTPGGAAVAVEQVVAELMATLNPYINSPDPLRPYRQLYDWLIRPVEAELAQSQIETLVFVLDGVLGKVPIAALYDGQHYLVERYSLALTPGLQLLPSRSLRPDRLSVLVGALSESRQGFDPLPNVIREIDEIAATIPTNILLNQTFTDNQLASRIETTSFPIVHLATHGQFSSQAESTFLLTWDGRINVKDLDQLLLRRERPDRHPIELLILSACQTAAGDERAALGLAGVALRSGARSTIATLWSVQDRSTAELMTSLYATLKQPNVTKAEALRQAQLSLLRSPDYNRPFFWGAFVLVGNWR